MQVSKWGNSLAVRLPAEVVEALDLKEGDQIEIRIASTREFEVRRDPASNRRDVYACLRPFAAFASSFAGWVRIRPGRSQCPLKTFSIRTC